MTCMYNTTKMKLDNHKMMYDLYMHYYNFEKSHIKI